MRLVQEAREQDPERSQNAAVVRIGQRVGVNPDRLRGWCKWANIDSGRRPVHAIGRPADPSGAYAYGQTHCCRCGRPDGILPLAEPGSGLAPSLGRRHRENYRDAHGLAIKLALRHGRQRRQSPLLIEAGPSRERSRRK